MNRALVLSLCAVTLAAFATSEALAQANARVALNLRYTDPADPSEGGTWQLVADTDDADGLVAISFVVDNIDLAGLAMGSGIGADLSPDAAADGTVVNGVYGQDTTDGTVITDVGNGAGTPGNQADDPLNNSAWDNVAVIATGTFGSTRPAFVSNPDFGGDTIVATLDPTVDPNQGEVATITALNVRGDSLASLGLETPSGAGLLLGDANRDGAVNLLTDIFPSLGAVNMGSGFGWDDGDFNDDGSVNLLTDIFPALGSINQPSTPPEVGAVPEPSTVLLAAFGAVALLRRRQR